MNENMQSDGNPSGEITFADIKSPAEYETEAALKLVVQDAERTEAWLGAQGGWSLRWAEADALYQSPWFVRPWEGASNGITRSNVNRFTVAKHVNSVVPTLLRGIFYDDPPFLLRPRPGTSQQTIRAKSALISSQLSDIGFYKSVKSGFRSMALFGTGIWKFGWLTESKKRKRYVRKRQPTTVDMPMSGEMQVHTEESDEFEVKEFMERIDRPFFDAVDIRHVLVDPGCRAPDIREAKFVIHREYLSLNDLNALRDVEGYDIPSEEALREIFDGHSKETPAMPGTNEQMNQSGAIHHAMPRYKESTVDPAEHGLEVLERWDNDKVCVVLQRKWVLRNEPNPFGKIPFFSANWWDIPDAFWGLGIGRIIGSDQRVEQGLTNAALDMLAMAVNPQYARRKGANVPTQQIRQRLGGIIDVETDGDVRQAFGLIEQPKVPSEVWAAIQSSESQAESATGANEQLVQGSMGGGKSSMGRTATGAGNLANAVASRLQDPVENFIQNVYEPWLYQLDELNNERLPMSTLRQVLGEELEKDFELDEENFLNARTKFEVLAGAHIAAKKTMAQAMPLMIQMFENPQMISTLNQTGWTVDLLELLRMMFEVSEWKNQYSVIRKMTDEEKQSAQANNPNVQKAQAQQAAEDQKFEHQGALVDQKNIGRAANEVLRQTFEKAATPEAVEGEAGGKGFGSQI